MLKGVLNFTFLLLILLIILLPLILLGVAFQKTNNLEPGIGGGPGSVSPLPFFKQLDNLSHSSISTPSATPFKFIQFSY